MEFTSKSEHAIHGIYYLSNQPENRLTYVSEIAREQNVSESYLAKIFQSLAKAGIVSSYRGSNGGYTLSRIPEKINLKEIIEAAEGLSPIFNCNGVRNNCSINIHCMIQETFHEAENKMFEVLENVTMKGISEQLNGQAIVIDTGDKFEVEAG